MKKWMLLLALLLCLTAAAGAEDSQPYTLVVATDMHYLSPSLTDMGERFLNSVYTSDGKVIHYSSQICEAFVRDMLLLKPDAVIVSGDITLNGAPVSHREFAAMMARLQDAGIQVLVIPGNHDVGGQAYRFDADGPHAMPNASISEFYQIYQGLGYADALSRDPNSLSYVAKLSDELWALMLDVNANRAQNLIKPITYTWIEEQLKLAQAQGVRVIGVSHQNLMAHNPFFVDGNVIRQSQKLLRLYRQYGVTLHLSGHIHTQHIMTEEAVTEIVTASMALNPGYYGVIRLAGGKPLSYDAIPVDVSAWAKEIGETNEDLLHFSEYTEAFFYEVVRRKVAAAVKGLPIDEAEKARMTEFWVLTSIRDFSGTRSPDDDETALALWDQYLPDTISTIYLHGVLDAPAQNMTHYLFD
ncbi:MAG: metallophosphoesterase [Clostridia bacterium]|nr:metallophosphoesterase [Clostridia bacterium]